MIEYSAFAGLLNHYWFHHFNSWLKMNLDQKKVVQVNIMKIIGQRFEEKMQGEHHAKKYHSQSCAVNKFTHTAEYKWVQVSKALQPRRDGRRQPLGNRSRGTIRQISSFLSPRRLYTVVRLVSLLAPLPQIHPFEALFYSLCSQLWPCSLSAAFQWTLSPGVEWPSQRLPRFTF